MKENSYPGIFIVIEGPDASGKETQAGRLVKWLRSSDFGSISSSKEEDLLKKMPGRYPDSSLEKVEDSIKDGVWRLSFPTYGQTPGGRVVEAYLNGHFGNRENLSMEEIVDIYAADRKQFKQVIYEYLSNGGIIICDRYREANLIHQLVGFEGAEWNSKLKYIKKVDSDLPDSDKIFYLDISSGEAAKRMSDKEKDIHELDNSYMKKCNQNGRKVARHENWEIIDGERSREEVEKELRRRVKELL